MLQHLCPDPTCYKRGAFTTTNAEAFLRQSDCINCPDDAPVPPTGHALST